MSCVTFIGQLKSKRFDEYGNCFLALDIDTCYKERIPSYYGTEPHTPRCDEFRIVNKRPLSCVNDIDLAANCDIGQRLRIQARELFDAKDNPVNRYQVISIQAWC